MTLAAFLRPRRPVVRLSITIARGSTPRAAGTEMFVAADGLYGTIGGGRLEQIAVDRAREMLRDATLIDRMDVPLGPEIGQCCGGFVRLDLTRMRAADRIEALDREARDTAARPLVYILGAGHVGRALAAQLALLPFRTILIDQRPEELTQATKGVETRLAAIPEVEIANAPAGSAFVVMTHDHGLDFLLTAAALERGDAAYVGLIGSATKRAKFEKWFRQHCDARDARRLTCPIGAGGSRDKRPAIIAALVAAELANTLTATAGAERPNRRRDRNPAHAAKVIRRRPAGAAPGGHAMQI